MKSGKPRRTFLGQLAVGTAGLGAEPVRSALYCGPWLVVADEQKTIAFWLNYRRA